jgi:hypothetical protein
MKNEIRVQLYDKRNKCFKGPLAFTGIFVTEAEFWQRAKDEKRNNAHYDVELHDGKEVFVITINQG